MNQRSRRWLSGIIATCAAALAAGWLSACVTPHATLEESADFKAKIVSQIRTTAAEDERDFADLARADAEDVWAAEAMKYWNHAHRDGSTSETLAAFVQASAEATRANLATNERRRALRVQKLRNAALAVDNYGKMKDAERARSEWLAVMLNDTLKETSATNAP